MPKSDWMDFRISIRNGSWQKDSVTSFLSRCLDVPGAHPLARRLLAHEREDLVGEVAPVVEEPPAAVGVGAVERPHVVQQGLGGGVGRQRPLRQPDYEQGEVAGEEVRAYVGVGPHPHRLESSPPVLVTPNDSSMRQSSR